MKSHANSTIQNPFRILEYVSSDPEIAISSRQLDLDVELINCQNGILDLKKCELLPHDPAHFMTKSLSASYFAEAKSDLWQSVLDLFTDGDLELQKFLARVYGGLGLPADNPAQRFIVLYGPGANGKSKFIGAIQHVMGDYCDVLRQEVLTSRSSGDFRHDVADLKEARFIVASEPPQGAQLNTSLIKELTGGDLIKGRHNYGASETFKCKGLITLTTNWLPEIDPGDIALKRRILIYRHDSTIPADKRIDDLHVQLESPESESAILKWLLDGRRDFLQNGLAIPDKVLSDTDNFLEQKDVFESFLIEKCVYSGTSVDFTTTEPVSPKNVKVPIPRFISPRLTLESILCRGVPSIVLIQKCTI